MLWNATVKYTLVGAALAALSVPDAAGAQSPDRLDEWKAQLVDEIERQHVRLRDAEGGRDLLFAQLLLEHLVILGLAKNHVEGDDEGACVLAAKNLQSIDDVQVVTSRSRCGFPAVAADATRF